MITNPQELSQEIVRSNESASLDAITAVGGTALTAVGFAAELIPQSLDVFQHIAAGGGIVGGAIAAVIGSIKTIRNHNRANALEATRTQLILSGAVNPDEFKRPVEELVLAADEILG